MSAAVQIARKLLPACLAWVVMGSIAQGQSTWFVDTDGTAPGIGTFTDPFTRIDFAVQQAQVVDGDTLLVMGGSYRDEAILLNGKGLAIVSLEGAEATSITGPAAESVSVGSLVTIVGVGTSPTSLTGFTFTEFVSPQVPPGVGASAVELIDSDVVIEDCVFALTSGDTPASLIDVFGGNPQFRNCIWDSNLFGCGGGVRATSADVAFTDCTFLNTTYPLSVTGGSLALTGCSLQGNMDAACATRTSGTVVASQATVTIEDTSFVGITSTGGTFIGPQHLELTDCQTTILASSLVGGLQESGPGAGIRAVNGSLSVSETSFSDLRADRGGAVGLEGTVALFVDCDFVGNDGGLEEFEGGAIEAQIGGHVTVVDCSFELNRSGAGGAIGTTDVPLVVKRSTFLGNRANRGTFFDGFLVRGGAIYATDDVEITDCTFEGNVAESGYFVPIMDRALGGALYLDSSALIDGCEFRNNRSIAGGLSQGGAIHAGPLCVVQRCIFDGNHAEGSSTATGGALAGTGFVSNGTFVRNTAVTGASVAETWLIRNSILVPADATPLGPGSKAEYSLVVGGAPGVGNIDMGPMFFSSNDFHLLPGSPAIDAGDPLDPTDPDGSVVDMGALPFQPGYCRDGCVPILTGPACPVVPNSTGMVGRTYYHGYDGFAGSPLFLAADQLPPGAVGFFLLSQRPGFAAQFAGGEGNLCMGAPVLRLLPATGAVNLAGQYGQVIDLAELPLHAMGLTGVPWNVQFWHRDQRAGQPTSNTSAGVSVLFR